LYKWAEPSENGGSGTPNPLDRLTALVRATGDTEPLEWLCEKCGGYFVTTNHSCPDDLDHRLRTWSNELVTQFAGMVALLAQTAIDGKITNAEAKDIRTSWTRVQSRTEAYVRQCEGGHFNPENSRSHKLGNG
jgi:hypothetical protein